MTLTFYFAPMSTASTVEWSLAELDVPFESVRVDLKSDESKDTLLGPVNPNRKVPVIVHDGVPIFESAAIQAYLGETFGVDKGLYPAPGPERGRALMWLVWCNVSLGEAVQRFYRNTSPEIDASLRHEKAGAQGKADVERHAGILDAHLEGRSYVVGETPTLVDFHLASTLAWLAMIGIDLTPFPHLGAWLERCCSRPAYGDLMADAA